MTKDSILLKRVGTNVFVTKISVVVYATSVVGAMSENYLSSISGVDSNNVSVASDEGFLIKWTLIILLMLLTILL